MRRRGKQVASFKALRRSSEGSAQTGRFAVLRTFSPLRLAALLALLATALLVALQLAGLHRGKAPSVPAFLTKALGAPQRSAPLVRKPAPHVSVTILKSGLKVADHDGSIALAAAAATGEWRTWRRYQQGVLRRTSFGSEAIVFDDKGQGGEQFLVVRQHHQRHTWRWRLDTAFTPRVTSSGVVGFFKGHRMVAPWIPPARVLDGHQHDVTPKGARWNVVRSHGSWWLELRLDDRKLPLPYAIDPAVLRASGAGTLATASTGTTLSVPIPAAATAQDLLIIHAAQATGTALSLSGWNVVNLSSGTSSSVTTTGLAELTWWKNKTDWTDGDQLDHIALTVPDVSKSIEGFRKKGVDIAKEPYSLQGSSGSIAFIKDPNGIWIELIEED